MQAFDPLRPLSLAYTVARIARFKPLALFANGEQGVWIEPSVSTCFADTAGTTPAGAGDAIARINDRSGNGNHATQVTAAARPLFAVEAAATFISHDGVDDALPVSGLPDLGAACTVAYVTQAEVRVLEDQSVSGTFTLPAQDVAGLVLIDRALTLAEKVSLIRYLAGLVDGVQYGAEIDRLTLIAMNAVDVFVYDTSTDSDGGAWRTGALAQASSWYNETLNTATRGARREFPAVAVIVAEASDVTIYDGDDPALPIWMKFRRAGGVIAYTVIGKKSLFMLNGEMQVSTASGLLRLNFLTDLMRFQQGGGDRQQVGIEGRGTIAMVDVGETDYIASSDTNDVAMTVLPDAPVDPATGLPVPTIAVATAGGVSVIRDDGTVVDSGQAFGIEYVIFDSEDGIYYRRDTTTGVLWYAAKADYEAGDGFGDEVARAPAGVSNFDLLTWGALSPSREGFDMGGAASTDQAVPGLSKYALSPADFSKGMSALLTSTYTTGWMPGDIKGAWLADTDELDLVGGTDADRSVNGTPLTVTGTITRSPVATGAELVGYSGFSAGVNELTLTDASISDTLYGLCWVQVGGGWVLQHGVMSTAPIEGVSIAGTTLTVAGANAKALLRLTATTPTSAQLAKIEADEAALFEANAACTLYGASDAVTALAHDPGTDLLHAGTSAGRSIFFGLERIGSTDTSVSAAISAASGLIVEK